MSRTFLEVQKLLLTLGREVLRAKLYKIQKSGKSLIWGICTSEWLATLQNQHCNKCAHTKGSVAACSVWSLGGGGNSTWRCAQGQFTVLCKGHILFNWKYGTKSITLPYPRNFCAMICLFLLQYFNENAILPVGLLSYQDWEIKMTHRSCACARPLLLELKPFCKTNMKFACFTTISVTMQFCYLVYLILIQINEKKHTKNNLMLQKNQLFTERQSGKFELWETFKLLKWQQAESSFRQPAAFSHAWNTGGINCHQTGNGSERAQKWDAKRKKGTAQGGKERSC